MAVAQYSETAHAIAQRRFRVQHRDQLNAEIRERYRSDPVYRQKRLIRSRTERRYRVAQPCESVNCTETVHTQRHHPDIFGRPWDIVWLCALCHKRIHS